MKNILFIILFVGISAILPANEFNNIGGIIYTIPSGSKIISFYENRAELFNVYNEPPQGKPCGIF